MCVCCVVSLSFTASCVCCQLWAMCLLWLSVIKPLIMFGCLPQTCHAALAARCLTPSVPRFSIRCSPLEWNGKPHPPGVWCARMRILCDIHFILNSCPPPRSRRRITKLERLPVPVRLFNAFPALHVQGPVHKKTALSAALNAPGTHRDPIDLGRT